MNKKIFLLITVCTLIATLCVIIESDTTNDCSNDLLLQNVEVLANDEPTPSQFYIDYQTEEPCIMTTPKHEVVMGKEVNCGVVFWRSCCKKGCGY